MEKVQLVYAELVGGISFAMLEDRQVLIISDNATFLVTTETNSHKYQEDFFPVTAEAAKDYNIQYREGRVYQLPVSDSF